MHRTLDALAPELIINPAAYTAVDRTGNERDIATVVNVDAPAAMSVYGASKLGGENTVRASGGISSTGWRTAGRQ